MGRKSKAATCIEIGKRRAVKERPFVHKVYYSLEEVKEALNLYNQLSDHAHRTGWSVTFDPEVFGGPAGLVTVFFIAKSRKETYSLASQYYLQALVDPISPTSTGDPRNRVQSDIIDLTAEISALRELHKELPVESTDPRVMEYVLNQQNKLVQKEIKIKEKQAHLFNMKGMTRPEAMQYHLRYGDSRAHVASAMKKITIEQETFLGAERPPVREEEINGD